MAGRTADELEQTYGERWRWYAVVTVMVTTMATVLSATSINVALADIMEEFAIGQGEIHWLATGYLAAMTVSMLCATWVLDHVGIRTSTIIAVTLFSVVSVFGGISADTSHLFIARLALGGIAGLMQPMAMYLVFRIFPKDKRGSVLGFYGFGIVLAPALGPVLGGFLVDQFSWRYVFYAPVPVTLIAVFLAWRFLPVKTRRIKSYPFDFTGFILLSVVIVCSLDALNSIQHLEVAHWRRIGVPVIASFALLVFIWFERRTAHPLLNLALLMRKQFMYAGFGAVGLGFAMFGTTYLIPVYTQTALGFSPTDAGLVMLPAGAVLAVTLLLASRLTDIMKSKYLLLGGIACMIVAALVLSRSHLLTGFMYVCVAAMISRVGLGLMLPSVSTGALNQLGAEELSDGSSTISFVRQLGGAYGINVIALIIEGGDELPTSAALPLAEYSAAWLFMVLVLGLLLIPVSRLKG